MPRLLEDKSGYFWVDGWDNVLSYELAFTNIEIELYSAALYPYKDKWKFVLDRLENNPPVPDYDQYWRLGYEERKEDWGIVQTMRWVKHGHGHWIMKEKEDE